jgi:hypothetical protein
MYAQHPRSSIECMFWFPSRLLNRMFTEYIYVKTQVRLLRPRTSTEYVYCFHVLSLKNELTVLLFVHESTFHIDRKYFLRQKNVCSASTECMFRVHRICMFCVHRTCMFRVHRICMFCVHRIYMFRVHRIYVLRPQNVCSASTECVCSTGTEYVCSACTEYVCSAWTECIVRVHRQ